jgi:hypothetical protein
MSRRERQFAKLAAKEEEEVLRTGALKEVGLKSRRPALLVWIAPRVFVYSNSSLSFSLFY